MGGKHGKPSKYKSKDFASLKMKDDYIKFIRQEQIRRENEFKQRVHDKDLIYNEVKKTCKLDELSFQNEDVK